ncbi:DNA methylase [bacterium]|jgi:16S rRNA G966 N2-methylase RsmD|nr:DNA methylase [bacterium]
MAKDTQQLFDSQTDEPQGPVECLGMTFENDAARRKHFLDRLEQKLADPEFRNREGFPNGENEAILKMSDPPFYTACPNPFLDELLAEHGTAYQSQATPYHRIPMAVDVSEGKKGSLYTAHAYHTKVPHKAIMRAILHYTAPGDVVLDGFSGSGMTGVANRLCSGDNLQLRKELENDFPEESVNWEWGARFAVLSDLSPAASFISANYNIPVSSSQFKVAATQLLTALRDELGWMYETLHESETRQINYTIWSQVFSCRDCGGDIVFFEEALDSATKRVQSNFPCPHCQSTVTKRTLDPQFETVIDQATAESWRRIRFSPVSVNFSIGKQKVEKSIEATDLDLLSKISHLNFPPAAPIRQFPLDRMYHGSRLAPKGFTHVHQLILPRPLQALGKCWELASDTTDGRLRHMLLFFVEQAIRNMSLLNAYEPLAFSQNARGQKIVYYVPSQHSEVSPWFFLDGKMRRIVDAFSELPSEYQAAVSTGSTTDLPVADSSVDYIFTDPPFGENIFYADLNLLVEAWHGVETSTSTEAIVDKKKGKKLLDYQRLMQRCFEEYNRVLKPGHWMTMVFHNSKNAVWNCIQEAMSAAGFVVADVRTLDKQQGSYRQVTSTAVKQDLVVSAYKPNGGLEQRFGISAGSEEGVWQFIDTHLRQLPVFVAKAGKAETIAERQGYLLYDRVVAFHVQRSVRIPIENNAEFHAQIAQKYPERDGMYFLPDQVAEYDRKRMTVSKVEQLDLFVSDEASAIQWLRQSLKGKPQTFQELQPQFMQEVAGWQKHEKTLELSEILDQNFLCYEVGEVVPSQIHAYLSSNFKELRSLPKDDPKLKAKAKDRWYVPDPRKEVDLEKRRHRDLMKQFNEYREAKGKLKTVRTEALRAGFKECWQKTDYDAIVQMAGRVREEIIQEDTALLMYYDNALMLTEA